MAIHRKMGWLPDYPDFRDYSPEHNVIEPLLRKAGLPKAGRNVVPPAGADLREWCSPVEDQGSLGSCTAQAAASLVEYFENRAYGKYTDASRLFIYKTTRNLLDLTGDTGAYIRTTLGALVLFGAPPEQYWPYVIGNFDKEPSAFCYSFAQNYKTISYFKLDTPNLARTELLSRLKQFLANGIPFIFGFTVYNSYIQAETTGKIPYPAANDSVVGGHALFAVGYDDSIEIVNNRSNIITTGALLVKNSWGTKWGLDGYGWLPYDYVDNNLAEDFWCVLNSNWLDTGQFFYDWENVALSPEEQTMIVPANIDILADNC